MSGFQKTGLTPDSPKHFVIDAATVFTDVKYTPGDSGAPGKFTGTPMGATQGGVKVAIEVVTRTIEVDGGKIMPMKGLNAVESMSCKITVPLKEFTIENLRRSLNGKVTDAEADEAPTGYKKLESKRIIEEGDYIPVVGVVGQLAGTSDPVIIIAENLLNTKALELDFQDGQEAIIEQELTAHASIESANAGETPWRIYFPGKPEGGE